MKQVYHFLMILFIICFTTNLYSQSVPSYVPTNGLVGWWGFNGNAQDGSGNGNHGTVNGATLTTDRFGNQNGAYSFDGINNSITVADNQSLRPSTISISVWVLSNNFINDGGCIISKTQPGTAQGEQYILGHDNLGSANFQIKRNSGCAPGVNWQYLNTSQNTILNSNWEHIVCTYDGITMKFYKGSALINSFVPQPGGIDNCAGGSLNIGRYWQSQFHYNGKIDDIGIWNRALTQYEITNLYNSQLPTQTSLCLPTITTNTPTSIGIDSVVIGGDILNDGGSSIVLRGLCYSTTPNPNMGNPRTEEGSGVGSFTSSLRNLSPSTTYYARSYAKNSQGVVVYGNEVSFSAGTPIPGIRCPGTPSVTDIDGNLYHTVQIGNQCWTQSNLKVSRYRNGDSIPTGLSNSSWGSTTSGAYTIYDNNPVNDGLYGKLYNHYAVMDTRGLCPTGWHVPTDGEWNVMVRYLDPNADTTCNICSQSTIVGGMLKSTLTQPTIGGWGLHPNSGTNNSTAFSAFSGGFRHHDSRFLDTVTHGYFWSASLLSSLPLGRILFFNSGTIFRGNDGGLSFGLSVRCLKNTVTHGIVAVPAVNTTNATGITSNAAIIGGNVTHDGGTPVTARGVAYGTSATPTTSGTITTDGTGMGVFTSTLTGLNPSTTYYVRAYATNSVGTAYGNEVSFITTAIPSFTCGTSTVSDVDGNNYNTVQIGNQCWTQSNLKVSKYRNGDHIPTGLSDSAWVNNTSGAYVIYNNDSLNDTLYGKLYNHYAVMDTRGLCPTGWHVPTDGEWNVMAKYLDLNADTVCNSCWQSAIAGGALKSTAIQPTPGGWTPPNSGATNSSNFTALPGGIQFFDSRFVNLGTNGNWWSMSFSGSYFALYRELQFDFGAIYRGVHYRTNGFSVRCLRD